MKKVIIVVMICVISLGTCLNVSYGTEVEPDEREKIIETVKRSWYIYDLLCGKAWDVGMVYGRNNPNMDYEFLKYGKDFLNTDNVKEDRLVRYDKENWEMYYYKTTFKDEDEYISYINSVFIGNTADIKSQPRTAMIDGHLYLKTFHDANIYWPEWDFENCTVETKDDELVVNLKGLFNHDMPVESNAVLKKVDNDYIVVGGTLYGEFALEHLVGRPYALKNIIVLYPANAPQTGDGSVFYIAIAAAALATMVTVVVKKRRVEE